MAELCGRIGDPQRAYRVIHVVGTNGKSSVAEMSRQLLGSQGLRAGAYISPHLGSWSERLRLPSGSEPDRFAAAIEDVAAVSDAITTERGEDWRSTQFEVATAASFLALARDDTEVAVIEAGLGGRLDATNVCEAEVVALTTVALDHTQWLGETIEEIAAEKLAVLDSGATLVVGEVGEEVAAMAESAARAAGGRVVRALDPRERPSTHAIEGDEGRSGFGAENLAVARCAVEALLGREVPLTDTGYGSQLPARAELIAGDPPVLLDLAHNPAAAAALAGLPYLEGRTVVACVALLDDKDLPGFAKALAPALAELVATEAGELPGSARPGASSHRAEALARAFRAAGVEQARAVVDPREAVEATIATARERGGVALITGSHYLLRHSWIPGSDRS